MTEEAHVFLNALFTALLTDLIDFLRNLNMHSTHSGNIVDVESDKITSFHALQSLCEKILKCASSSS